MAIAPVSSVNFRNNAFVNFGSKCENDNEGQEFTPSKRQGTTDLSKMPVAVLLAMTPTISEAKLPNNHLETVKSQTEMCSYADIHRNTVPTYVINPQVPDVQKSDGPYGYECLKHERINLTHKFQSNGREYTLLYTSKSAPNAVDFVYIIPKNSRGGDKITDTPPEVTVLRYHNLGKDKEFCGAVIDEDLKDNKTGKYLGVLRQEVRLPDVTAQLIIDLVTKHSKFKNGSIVTMRETDSPLLLPIKLYE